MEENIKGTSELEIQEWYKDDLETLWNKVKEIKKARKLEPEEKDTGE